MARAVPANLGRTVCRARSECAAGFTVLQRGVRPLSRDRGAEERTGQPPRDPDGSEPRRRAASDDRNTTDLTATVEGTEGPVVFRMVQAPSGRWRVLQVIAPGGDTGFIPWSIPTG